MNTTQHKAGFVNIIGNPNVGKSTLLNRLVGERLAIISPKAQTTRHRIKGIVNGEDFQIVYSDLPGILTPSYKMQELMMRFVNESLKDADIVLYLVECNQINYHSEIIEKLNQMEVPVIVVLNKIDKAADEEIITAEQYWKTVLLNSEIMRVSALRGQHVNLLMERIVTLLPDSPPYFPKDELTDRPTRFFISEIIREKILLLYKKEIPYCVEVVIESFKEEEELVRIGAMLYCERDTQKAIIIGSKGSAIKQLGIESRKAIEEFLDKHIFLDISVKVLKDWRNQDLVMRRFGYYQE